MAKYEKQIKIFDQRISQTGESISKIIADITKNTQIKFETLRKAHQRSKEKKIKQHGNCKFSDAEEKRLCSIILAFSASGIALSRTIFISFVRKIFSLGDDWRGDHWFSGFVIRHSNLVSHAFSKDLDTGRVNSVTPDIIDSFIREYQRLLTEKNYSPDFIINADESPCKFTDSECTKILMNAKSKKQG